MESPSTAISQVCQNWRRIALRTPTLWRDISLQAAPNWIRSYTENRSMQLNIEVGMKGGVHADIASEDYESEFGGFGIMLHSYWHRVSSLHIHSFVPTSIVLPLSHLGEITVDGIPPHYLYDDLGFNTSGALPALRKLVVPQLPSTIFSGPSVLGITSLTIQYVSFDTLFSSSKWWDRVPRLEELVIEWFKGDVPTLPFRSLKLFTLRHLRIRSRGKDIPPSFHGLDLFEVPKLQSLEICPSKRHDLYHPDINDSSPPDDVLKLGQIFYTCEEPRYIDKHMWKFSNVWHYRASVGNQFFAMLTEINPKTLVPLHLQNLLELDIETPSTGLDAKVFLQFLRIRLYGVQRLTRAEVLFQYQSLPQSLIRELGIVTRRFIEENRDGALVIRHQIPKTTFREDQHSGKLITRRVLLT
ncbi:hypothetical protein DL96DRAFT_1623513 [Flagelloscypha sp. PMI_526]|nr:hypothetical protein DL96DRAFT_1623513 [Flagelloscypha sp. PMI_526]